MKKTLRFHHGFSTRLSVQAVWREFETAFTDSKRSQAWPNHLETLKSHGVKKACHIPLKPYSQCPLTKRPLIDVRLRPLVPIFQLNEGRRHDASLDRRYIIGLASKERGGIAIVQDPKMAEQDTMPKAAIAAANVWVESNSNKGATFFYCAQEKWPSLHLQLS